jgi:hypothetical protein
VDQIVEDGRRGEHFSVTIDGARELAKALIEAADEIDGWVQR